MKILNKESIEKTFLVLLNNLSEKEKKVLKKRLGLDGEKMTLQSIGNTFEPSITRERVRQIEESGIKNLSIILNNSPLYVIQEKAYTFIKLNGGLSLKTQTLSYLISEFKLLPSINNDVLDVIIQAKSGILKSRPKLGVKTYFYLEGISKRLIEQVHKEALKILKKRKNIMNQLALSEQIKKNLGKSDLSITLINSIMDIYDDIVKGEQRLIALKKRKILNPKTLKDKAIYILKKEKVPMHFIDISNKISEYLGENVKVNTIHNELIRHEEFVLIGRGVYALKEWGFKAGTVLDVIIDLLKKKKEPMSTEEIIKGVLKVRNVKKSTVYMNLQNRKYIDRVGRRYYKLKLEEEND